MKNQMISIIKQVLLYVQKKKKIVPETKIFVFVFLFN